MLRKRLTELVAIGLIGDGVVALAAPERHSLLWLEGSENWRRFMRLFAERPMLTRVLAAGEVAVGLWLALRQYSD